MRFLLSMCEEKTIKRVVSFRGREEWVKDDDDDAQLQCVFANLSLLLLLFSDGERSVVILLETSRRRCLCRRSPWRDSCCYSAWSPLMAELGRDEKSREGGERRPEGLVDGGGGGGALIRMMMMMMPRRLDEGELFSAVRSWVTTIPPAARSWLPLLFCCLERREERRWEQRRRR